MITPAPCIASHLKSDSKSQFMNLFRLINHGVTIMATITKTIIPDAISFTLSPLSH